MTRSCGDKRQILCDPSRKSHVTQSVSGIRLSPANSSTATVSTWRAGRAVSGESLRCAQGRRSTSRRRRHLLAQGLPRARKNARAIAWASGRDRAVPQSVSRAGNRINARSSMLRRGGASARVSGFLKAPWGVKRARSRRLSYCLNSSSSSGRIRGNQYQRCRLPQVSSWISPRRSG